MDAIVASVINSSSLNCRTNSSSSSISSGYASGQSAASTPATPISSHYDTSPHTTMTSASSAVSSADQLPTATVAPVMPFYSETSLGQQQRQNYYQSYPYTNSSTQYNPVYDAYTGNSYHDLTTPSVERNTATGSGRPTSTSTYHQRTEKQQKPLPAYSASGVGSQHYGNTSTASASTSTTSATTTKPQATATQFFAQPRANVNTTAATYYDAYGKYKLPNTTKLTSPTVPDYATNYTNHLQHAAAAATFSYQQQQQHYYAAAKSQLQDVSYVGAVVKPHRQTNIGNSTAYYNSGSAYYDKYMYAPTPNAAAYSAPPQNSYPPHEPSSVDPYRSNRISAPWKMDYATASVGNCRNLPYVGNSGSYLATPSVTGNGRDSFCAAATDKYDKFDKYNAYYGNPHHPQQYIQNPSAHSAISGPSATTRSLWPNTPHQTPPHLATTMPTVIPHSLSPSAPTPHQFPHTHSNTHHAFVPTATNTTTQRTQSCCTQPFQQQSCYFPRATQQYPHVAVANAYATQPTQPTQYGTITGSSAHKYAAYTGTYKTNSSNDLYLSSPFDPPPPQAYNYNGPTTTAITQRFGGMAATNSPFYNNDLNVQPGFESYANNTHAMSPTSVMSQNVAVAHQPTHHLSYQQTYGHTSQSSGATDLLEYRKPLSSAETSTANDFCMNSTHITQHVADTPSYLTYDIHGNPVAQAHAVITSPSIYCDGTSSSEKSTPTTKNLSLRDFLATWNEEEEEDINNSASEQLSYIAETTENSQYISDSRSEITALTTSVPNSSEQAFQQSKNSYEARPKIHVGITVDESIDAEAAASQCVNLPDIIIDIEKTNNTGTTISPLASTKATESTLEHHHHSPCGGTHELFENFDVEKELDELQIKRAKMCLEKQLNNEIRILTPEPIQSLNEQLVENISSKDQAEVEQHHNTTSNIQHTECEKSYHNPDHFLKEIELNDDNNSHSSNSSTFEKEYETFINRIDLDKVCEQPQSQQRKEPIVVSHNSSFIQNNCSESVSDQSGDIKTPPDHIIAHEEMMNMNDCTQDNDFTTFYKKKRMLIKDENEGEIKTQLSNEFKSNIEIETTKNTDAMPQLSTAAIMTTVFLQKRYRKARKNIPVNLKRRRTNISQLYKIFKLRRLRANTAALVQKHIAMLKERHLPLIKRQSFKNYSSCDKVLYNPSSLMHLTVSFVNTAAYQEQLLFERDIVLKNNCSKNYGEERKDCKKIHTKDITNTNIQYIYDEYNLKNIGTTEVEETSLKNDASLDKVTEKEFEESNSNSLNGTASLKEQDDFNGFDEQQISENHCAEENVLHYIESRRKSENSNQQEPSKTEEHTFQSRAATTTAIKMTERRTTSIETSKTSVFSKGDCIMEEEELECTLCNVENLQHDRDDDIITIEKSDKMVKDSLQLFSKTIVDTLQNSNSLEDIPQNITDDATSKIQVSSEAERTLHNASPEAFGEEYQKYNQSKALSISSQPSDQKKNPTETQTQPLPVMRTKASVKMCDFSNVQPRLRSSKSRSKSKSPISEKSSKFKYKKSSALSCIEKVDKTKFIEKWAESVGPRNFQLLSTKDPEVLDLSSRNLENSKTFHIAEFSNSSVTMSSSSSSSSSKSYHKSPKSSSSTSSSSSSSSSTSSSSSSSSSSNSTKSFIATQRRDHISSDGSEFNELKALEKELSQHKTLLHTEGWSQKETVKITDAAEANSQDVDTFNVKKTEENTQTKAQDIAELKKILECEQNEVVDEKVSLQCEKPNHSLMDNGSCSELISTKQELESCKNITKAFLANETLNCNSIRDSISNVNYQKYHNQQHVDEQKQHDAIPKLSDLCEIALNSSFVIKNINCKENEKNIFNVGLSVTNKPIPPKSPVEIAEATEATTQRSNSPSQHCEEQRELTVEEALAEMYRQAGVLSDPEDADDGLPLNGYGENEAQDFLLIDLAEILESNETENNVFVLQCDMNENLVRVVTASSENATTVPSHASTDNHSADDNSLQLVELLTTSNYELISDSNAEDLRREPPLLHEATNDSIVIGTEDSYSAISNSPIIHHEEIVPDNYKEFAKKEFIKYLHAKYVQKNVKKFHHANRILKKYRRRFLVNKSINYLETTQCSPM